MLQVTQVPLLSDNYSYIIVDSATQEAAIIDPALDEPLIDLIEQNNWRLKYILNTHHHHDHVGGNLAIKKTFDCQIIASRYDRQRIPGIDQSVNHHDKIRLGESQLHVIATPGHTLGHIVYYCAESAALFCGDTLFSMGCGRLFEGSAEQMWESLQLLKQLPEQTRIYCAHEYTLNNGHFAKTVEPNNTALLTRINEVEALTAQGLPTIPCTLKQELATNPFLRTEHRTLQQTVGTTGHSEIETFATIRNLKDQF